MKAITSSLVCCVATLVSLGSATHVSAVPMGGSNMELEHAIGTADAKKWSCGVYTVDRQRNIDMDGDTQTMESKKTMGYLGYSFSLYGWPRWFDTYVCAGTDKSRIGVNRYFGGNNDYGDDRFEGGVGMNFHLIDQEIADPTLFEDKLRLRGGWQLTRSSSNSGDTDTSWDELFLHLTLSVVNDLDSNKLYLPNSIALYFGPIMSILFNTDGIERESAFGYTAGVEIYYTEDISLDVAIEDMDHTDVTAGVHLRF